MRSFLNRLERRTKVVLGLITGAFLVVPSIIYAATDFIPISPVPGLTDTGTSSLPVFVNNLFTVVVSLSITTAVLFITWGGIKYITSAAPGGKADGRAIITRSIGGLLLVLSAVLILNTINPNLLKLNVVEPVKIVVDENAGADGSVVSLEGGAAAATLWCYGGATPSGRRCFLKEDDCKALSNLCTEHTPTLTGIAPWCLETDETLTGSCEYNDGDTCEAAKPPRKNSVCMVNPHLDTDTTGGSDTPDTSFSSFGLIGDGYDPVREQKVRAYLAGNGILVTSSGGINSICTSADYHFGCTAVAGLPDLTIKGLVLLKQHCEAYYPGTAEVCSIQVTGGSEGGHATHGVGLNRVDVDDQDPDVNKFIQTLLSNEIPTCTSAGIPAGCSTLGPWYSTLEFGTVLREHDHWHFNFQR
jgi:hypothetical protein